MHSGPTLMSGGYESDAVHALCIAKAVQVELFWILDLDHGVPSVCKFHDLHFNIKVEPWQVRNVSLNLSKGCVTNHKLEGIQTTATSTSVERAC